MEDAGMSNKINYYTNVEQFPHFFDDTEIEIEYEYNPEQKQTYDCPHIPASVDIVRLYVNGVLVSDSYMDRLFNRKQLEILSDFALEGGYK